MQSLHMHFKNLAFTMRQTCSHCLKEGQKFDIYQKRAKRAITYFFFRFEVALAFLSAHHYVINPRAWISGEKMSKSELVKTFRIFPHFFQQ